MSMYHTCITLEYSEMRNSKRWLRTQANPAVSNDRTKGSHFRLPEAENCGMTNEWHADGGKKRLSVGLLQRLFCTLPSLEV